MRGEELNWWRWTKEIIRGSFGAYSGMVKDKFICIFYWSYIGWNHYLILNILSVTFLEDTNIINFIDFPVTIYEIKEVSGPNYSLLCSLEVKISVNKGWILLALWPTSRIVLNLIEFIFSGLLIIIEMRAERGSLPLVTDFKTIFID